MKRTEKLTPVRQQFFADKHMAEECTKWLAAHGHFEYSYIEAYQDGFRAGREYAIKAGVRAGKRTKARDKRIKRLLKGIK